MDEKKKAQMIAEAENIEAIKDFFSEWYSLEQLYEISTKAAGSILHLRAGFPMSDEEYKDLKDFYEAYVLMVERMKPFARKEDEV